MAARAQAAPGDSARGHRGRLGVQTWHQYHDAMRRHVVPTLGSLRLQKLAAAELDRLYDTLERTGGRTGTGVAPKTIADVHGILHKALRDAVRAGLVARNVAGLVGPPKANRPQPRWWSPEQLGTFLRHVQDDRLYAMWLLFATTGMRRGDPGGGLGRHRPGERPPERPLHLGCRAGQADVEAPGQVPRRPAHDGAGPSHGAGAALPPRRGENEILNYHRTGGASNGPTEAVNLAVKRIKRVGHGFTNLDNYRLRLLLHCGGVNWQDQPAARLRGRRPQFAA